MTNAQGLETLQRLRGEMRSPSFRSSIQSRRDCLAQIVPMLNFNDVYYANAMPIANVLGRPGFTNSMYENTFAQMDSIMGQAIAELENNLTPKTEPISTPTQPTKLDLADEHDVWWFFSKSTAKTRLKFLAVLGAVFLVGLGFASNQFFMRLFNLVKSSAAPATSGATTTTNTTTK